MIFRSKKMKYNIKGWTDIMSDHVAFILGNGPSINELRLDLLESFFTIGINRIFKIFYPTILFWQDKEITRSYHKEIELCPSLKVCRDKYDTSSLYTNYFLDINPYRFHKTPWHLYGRGCSGGIAIQMAVAMGFRSIVLLGCDCKYKNDKTDFYGKNKFHRPHTLVQFNKAMQWAAQECPIPIYNCGDAPYWPKISLQEAIEITQPKLKSKLEFLAMLK